MKNRLIYLNFLALSSLLLSCSKDLGNYDYKAINDQKIIGGVLNEGTHPSQRIYRVIYGKEISIKPEYEGTVSGNDLSNIEFSWKVDGEVVSTDKELHYKADKKFGKLFGELKMLDKSTSISKTYSFFVDVINGYKSGYYFLTKDNTGKAGLYCIAPQIDSFSFSKINVSNVPNLGNNPLHISGYKDYGNAASDFWNVIFIGVQNGQYPIIQIDSRQFLATKLYNNSSFVGGANVNLAPTQVWGDPYDGEIVNLVNDGKLYVGSGGVIADYKFRYDPLDYHIPPNGMFQPGFYFKAYRLQEFTTAFYDDKNKTIRILTSLNNQGFAYTKSHDEAIDKRMLEGQEFLYGSYNIRSVDMDYTFVTKKGNVLSMYSVILDLYTDEIKAMTKVGETEIPGGQKITNIYFDDEVDFYYLSVGRTIYRVPLKTINGKLSFERYIDLPADNTGDISTFSFKVGLGANDRNRLAVVTEDNSQVDNKKSSVYIYDVSNLTLKHTLKNSMESVADVFVGN